MNRITTYISGVGVISAYNIDDLYHNIVRIDTLGIRLIIIIVYFLVVICTVLLSYLISSCVTSDPCCLQYNVYALCMMLSVASVVSCAA